VTRSLELISDMKPLAPAGQYFPAEAEHCAGCASPPWQMCATGHSTPVSIVYTSFKDYIRTKFLQGCCYHARWVYLGTSFEKVAVCADLMFIHDDIAVGPKGRS